MTYGDIKNAIDVITESMNKPHAVVIQEGDFVSADTKLSDTQVKQIFMILSQASVYKKVQGNLNGYTPSIKADKIDTSETKDFDATLSPIIEDEILNELDPFGGLARMKDAFMAKFGDKGAKMAQVAKNTSQDIWQKWESDSVSGGISPTVESLSKWINQKGVDIDLIDVAFRAVGVPNVKNTLRAIVQTQRQPIKSWMEENGITPGRLNGKVLKDYLLDVDVKEEDMDKVLADIGVKNQGTMLSKAQVKNVEKAVSSYTPTTSDTEDTEDTPDIDNKPNGAWSANDVYKHIIDNYTVDADELAQSFKKAGVTTPEEQMGDDKVRKILNSVQGDEKNMFTSAETTIKSDDRMAKTQQIIRDLGGSINQAKTAGQKAIDGDVSTMSELQKLGVAILTARKKI